MQIQLTDTALTKVQSFLDDHGGGRKRDFGWRSFPGVARDSNTV